MTPLAALLVVVAFAVGVAVAWRWRGRLAEIETVDLLAEATNSTLLLAQALDDRQAAVDETARWRRRVIEAEQLLAVIEPSTT